MPISGLSRVCASIAGAVISVQLRRRRTRLVLLQNADDLFFCKCVLYSLTLSKGQSLLQMDYFNGARSNRIENTSLFGIRGKLGAQDDIDVLDAAKPIEMSRYY